MLRRRSAAMGLRRRARRSGRTPRPPLRFGNLLFAGIRRHILPESGRTALPHRLFRPRRMRSGRFRRLRGRWFRPAELLASERLVERHASRHPAAHGLHDAPAPVHHRVARPIDFIDEVAVDEHAGQNPAAEQQDQRSEDPDTGMQHRRDLDAERPAPTRRAADAPVVTEGESQGQRPENQDEEQREKRMVHQQRTLTDDPQPHERHHHGNQYAEHPERIVHQQTPQPSPRLAAEVLHLVAEQLALLGRLLQDALVHIPADEREEDRRDGEQSREEEQQAPDPADAIAVGPFGSRPPAGGRRRIIRAVFGCHVV